MAGRKIAFLHVPKSSGMAIEAGIVSSLAPKAPFLNHMDHSTFGDFQEFETFPATEKRRIVSSPDEFPQDADFVSGHFALSNLKTAYPDHEFFSVVREPKCRLLSHWIYWRSFSDEALLRVGTMAERVKISRGTFFEFLTSKSIGCQTDNCFARMLLWPNQTIPENDFISSEHDDKIFAQVSAELARFDCVGMYEDKQLDHKLSHYLKCEFSRPRINETTTRSDATFPEFSKELDQNTMQALNERTRIDRRIWNSVAEKSNGRAAVQAMAESAWARSTVSYIEKKMAEIARPDRTIGAADSETLQRGEVTINPKARERARGDAASDLDHARRYPWKYFVSALKMRL